MFKKNILKIVLYSFLFCGVASALHADTVGLHQELVQDERVTALFQENLEDLEISDDEKSLYQWIKSKIKRRHVILAMTAAVIVGVAVELKWHPCKKTYQWAKNYFSLSGQPDGGQRQRNDDGIDLLRNMLPEEERVRFDQAYLAQTPEYQRFIDGQLNVLGLGHHLRHRFMEHYQQNHDVEQTMNWFRGELGDLDHFREIEELLAGGNNRRVNNQEMVEFSQRLEGANDWVERENMIENQTRQRIARQEIPIGIALLRDTLPERERPDFEQVYLAQTPENQYFMEHRMHEEGARGVIERSLRANYDQTRNCEQAVRQVLEEHNNLIDRFRGSRQMLAEINNRRVRN